MVGEQQAPACRDEAPPLDEAAERVMEATRGVVEDRIGLVRLELRETGTRVGRATGLLVAAALLGLSAWWLLSGAGYMLLRQVLAPAASLAVLAGLNGALALLLARAAASRLRDRS